MKCSKELAISTSARMVFTFKTFNMPNFSIIASQMKLFHVCFFQFMDNLVFSTWYYFFDHGLFKIGCVPMLLLSLTANVASYSLVLLGGFRHDLVAEGCRDDKHLTAFKCLHWRIVTIIIQSLFFVYFVFLSIVFEWQNEILALVCP